MGDPHFLSAITLVDFKKQICGCWGGRCLQPYSRILGGKSLSIESPGSKKHIKD